MIVDLPNIDIDEPKMADICSQLQGCLNGDVFKFGGVLGIILIGIELLCWVGIGIFIVKKFKRGNIS